MGRCVPVGEGVKVEEAVPVRETVWESVNGIVALCDGEFDGVGDVLGIEPDADGELDADAVGDRLAVAVWLADKVDGW